MITVDDLTHMAGDSPVNENVLSSIKIAWDWLNATKTKNKKTATRTDLTAEDYEEIKDLVNKMRLVDKYEESSEKAHIHI